MELIESFLLKGWTPGAVGVWTLVALSFIAWWRVLPAVINAIANRRSKIEERLGLEMDKMSERFMREIKAADVRHDECLAGQKTLRDRIGRQDNIISTQNKTIAEQTGTIVNLSAQVYALKASNQHLQTSIVESVNEGKDNAMGKMITMLKEVK